MDERDDSNTGPSGMTCGEPGAVKIARRVRRAGRGNGPRDNLGTAPRSDPYTKLRGPQRGDYYDLYVIIDIYSRYVVAWTVADAEDGELARDFIEAALIEHGIEEGQLSLHADRGGAMTSKPVAQLLIDLGVARTHSRPKVSNDNPYSESNFKTLKYCPAFPGHFGSIQDAREFCTAFFDYYNHQHRSPGVLGLWRHVASGRLTAFRATVLQGCGARGPEAGTVRFGPYGSDHAPSSEKCRACATPVVHVARP